MPIKECTEDGKHGYRWGDSGKCYLHDGSEEGKRRARRQAEEQAAAAYAHGYEGNAAPPGTQRKSLGQITKMAPSQPSDIELIKQHMQPGAEVNPEEVFVASAKLAHDLYDRSSERFPEEYLQRFADTIPGRALMVGHDYNKKPSGRWFDAEVRPDGNGKSLFAKFYVNAKSEIAQDIRLGIAKDVSIGFIPDKLICDMCQKDVHKRGPDACPHIPGQMHEGKLATATYGGDASKAEAVEGSLVWLGCQPGAQVMGQSSPTYQWKMALAAAAQDTQGDNSMELKEALAEIDRLKAELAASGDHKKQAEAYVASLTREALRKTKAIHFATTRDEKAAEKQVEFTGRLIKSASVADLEAMNTELDEQMKTVMATGAQAEGASHVKAEGGTDLPKRQPWEPRRLTA